MYELRITTNLPGSNKQLDFTTGLSDEMYAAYVDKIQYALDHRQSLAVIDETNQTTVIGFELLKHAIITIGPKQTLK